MLGYSLKIQTQLSELKKWAMNARGNGTADYSDSDGERWEEISFELPVARERETRERQERHRSLKRARENP
jgi:hypothetical protein